jgi:signal transduction histidine kinase
MLIGVAIAPLTFVWLVGFDEPRFERNVVDRALDSVKLAAMGRGEEAASVHHTRVRLLAATARSPPTTIAKGQATSATRSRTSSLVRAVPRRPAHSTQGGDRSGPLERRAEVLESLSSKNIAWRCQRENAGRLLVCAAALRLADGSVVHAQAAAPRAIHALHELRWPLTKLTLVVVAGALGLSYWLGRRLVRPIERLRDEVLARTAAPDAAQPLPVRTGDEIGDLARAFNELLAALTARGRANEAFAADLVHELKSPIAAIRAAAEALESPLDRERAARLSRVLGESSARLDS